MTQLDELILYNISLHVIEATRKALLGFSLEEIYKDVLAVNLHIETSRGVKYSRPENNKIAMITTCLTGEGGSVAVKSILNNSLKFDKDLFEIITLSCMDKMRFKQDLAKIAEDKEILFIVSSFPVDADVKQYNMYDVISMSVLDELQESIDIKATLVKMPSVLKGNIHNLDGFALFHDIKAFLKILESSFATKLKDAVFIGLVLHIAFMISRLKKGETTIDYPNIHTFIDENQKLYHIIKDNYTILSNKYSTNISDNEICYMMDHLLNYLSSIH